MLIVTMTTVGFGDFVPRTLMARSFVAVIAVIGIFLMALCISLVHESLQLTQQEKRILAYVESTGMKHVFIQYLIINIVPCQYPTLYRGLPKQGQICRNSEIYTLISK